MRARESSRERVRAPRGHDHGRDLGLFLGFSLGQVWSMYTRRDEIWGRREEDDDDEEEDT